MNVTHVAGPDGIAIAFAVHGSGPGTPVVSMRPPQFSHVVLEHEAGPSHHEYERYQDGRCVIRYDPRGTGLSSRGCPDLGLDRLVQDLELVLDNVGAERVVLDAISSSALTAFGLVAKAPERVERLIVQNGFLNGERWWSNPVRRALVNIAEVDWELCTETWAWMTWGHRSRERTLGLASYIRQCVSADDFLAMVTAESKVDFHGRLGHAAIPTLVLSHPRFGRVAPEEHNTDVAAEIPGAIARTIRSTDERVRAIRAFVDGRQPEESGLSARAAAPHDGSVLSTREHDVLRLMAAGLTNRAIAERLVVSVRTVDAHVRSIYAKTGVTSRAGAAAFAIRHDLL